MLLHNRVNDHLAFFEEEISLAAMLAEIKLAIRLKELEPDISSPEEKFARLGVVAFGAAIAVANIAIAIKHWLLEPSQNDQPQRLTGLRVRDFIFVLVVVFALYRSSTNLFDFSHNDSFRLMENAEGALRAPSA
jgi:hypothetical protein